MKKLLLGAAFAFSILTATAQNKFGYVNFGEAMSSMPEVEKAQKTLQAYQADQAATYQEMTIDFNAMDSIFNADSLKWNDTKKDLKRKELNTKYIDIQTFQQSAQENSQKKQEEIVGPIREKALKIINDVARENGYTYVFNDENTLLVKPQGDNIINLVKAKMGVKAPAPKPVGTAPKPTGGRR